MMPAPSASSGGTAGTKRAGAGTTTGETGSDTALGDTALGDTAPGDTAPGDTASGDAALGGVCVASESVDVRSRRRRSSLMAGPAAAPSHAVTPNNAVSRSDTRHRHVRTRPVG